MVAVMLGIALITVVGTVAMVAQVVPSSNVTDGVVGAVFELDGGRVVLWSSVFKYEDLGDKYNVYTDKEVRYGVSASIYGVGWFERDSVLDGRVSVLDIVEKPETIEERLVSLEERVAILEGK